MLGIASLRRLCLLGCPLLAAGVLAGQDTRTPAPRRLAAFFWHDSPNDLAALEGVRRGLRAAGLPHVLEVLHADSDEAKGRAALDALAARPCDLLFAMGTQAALLARDRHATLPVVYTAVTNPVASGVVPGWQGSGRNLAGNSNWIAPETLLHVFRQAVPKLGRLGMLRSHATGVVSGAELQAMREHLGRAGAPKVEVVEALTPDAAGIAAAVQALRAAEVDALWIPIDFTIYQNMPAVLAASAGSGLPLLSSSLQAARDGAVVGVLVDYPLLGQRAAALAVEILAGRRRPGEIPVDTMRGYQVLVNLAAARRAGYEVPLSLLVLADILIDAEGGGGGGDGRR